MRHIVMTRFNVRFTDGDPIPDEAWLRDRIELFERFTAPSMAAQTVQPDSWVIFCDAASPEWLVGRLEQVATVQRITGAFTSDVAAEVLCGPANPLVTTRLDNDDAIAVDFLESVQREAPREGYVNFMHGLQLAGEKLYRRSDPSNAFISRVERGSVEGVFAEKHRLIVERHVVHQVKSAPKWLQVIHGDNVANAARGIRTSRENLAPFAVDVQVTNHAIHADQIRSAVRLGARVVRRPHRMLWALRVIRG